MDDQTLPNWIMSGESENVGKYGPREKKESMDFVVEGYRVFHITGDWSTAALEPGDWYNTCSMQRRLQV